MRRIIRKSTYNDRLRVTGLAHYKAWFSAVLLCAALSSLTLPSSAQVEGLNNLDNRQNVLPVYELDEKKKSTEQILEKKKKTGDAPDIKTSEDDGTNTTDLEEEAEEFKIVLNELIVDGVTVLESSVLEETFSKYIGKRMGFTDFVRVASEITDLYKERGYVTTRAILPPQEIKDGTLRIMVIEGRIGKFEITNNKYVSTKYIEKRLHQEEGDVFRLQNLEKDVVGLNNRPILDRVHATLKPGDETGTSDIELRVDDHFPMHVSLNFDNTGRPDIGLYRSGITVQHENFTGVGDSLVANYTRADRTKALSVQYNYPIRDEWTLGGSYSYSKVNLAGPSTLVTAIQARTHRFGINTALPLYKSKDGRWQVSADSQAYLVDSMVFLSTDHFLINRPNTNPKRLTFGKKIRSINREDEFPSVRAITTGVNVQEQDTKGRTVTRLAMTNGIDLFGGNQSYIKFNGDVTRILQLFPGIVGVFRGQMQYTPNRLPGLEQMQIGGNASVRGYSEGFLSGDRGYLLSAEVRYPLYGMPEIIKKRFQGLVFYEMGGVFISDNDWERKINGSVANGTPGRLQSAGVGIRGQVSKNLTGRADIGFVMNPFAGTSDVRLHFGLNSNLF